MANPGLTDGQMLEALRLLGENGSISAAARAAGIPRATLQNRIHRAQEAGLHLSQGAREAMSASRLGPMEVSGGYRHVYDADGKKIDTVQWRVARREAELQTAIDTVRDALEGVKPAKPVAAPKNASEDLLTLFPLADVHIGMRAYWLETGSSYDTDIASARVRDWIGRLMPSTPPSGKAVILDVGDYIHANDDTNQTPRSKHALDVDTRMFRTLDVAISTLSAAVDLALLRHSTVDVCILPGNHDQTAYLAVMFGIAERYRNEPRVNVHKKPGEFYVQEFGKVMIAAHHGDKSKANNLVHFIADEYADIWGRTRHRFLYTGHLHHHKSQDIGGMRWEQLRAVTERDAYAVSHAYSARAQMQAITYHRDNGEVQRIAVNA